MSKKWVLLNPGPVNVTPTVRRSLLGPDLCHREKEFSDRLASVRTKILKIFGISKTHTVAVLTGSGTAALEAMLCSVAEADKKILVLSNGVYGDRVRYILEVHGTPVDVLSAEAGDFPSLEKIESLLKQDKAIQGIAMVHHETSTGMLNPIGPVSKLAKKYKKTFLVDAVSSLGAEPIDFADIDFCAASSGKCLHGFPGVSFVIISRKEAAKHRPKRPGSLYLDLWNTLKHEDNEETPFTPAVQLFYALDTALDELIQERLAHRIRTYRMRSEWLERSFMDLGLRFVVEKKFRSHVLTALWMPQHMAYKTLHARLKKEGFIIYAGQSRFAGKIFRVSHLGEVGLKDIKRFILTLKKILRTR